jgi:ABC-type nitrate/sulfonate/bicarbonate transport system ATPase subunit
MDKKQGLGSSEQVLRSVTRESNTRILFNILTTSNSPDDVFIAVLGLTGVGKSTFVTLCTQKEIHIGHHLESCQTPVPPLNVRNL